MSKSALLTALHTHRGVDEKEIADTQKIIQLVEEDWDACLYRNRPEAHITGSALLMSMDTGKILLMFHKYQKRWLQFGGHVDGNSNILEAAIRETVEESGITDVFPLCPDILDIDIHFIAANPIKNEGDHYHYDIRYLLGTENEDFTAPEGHEMRWFAFDELKGFGLTEEVWRIINKAQDWWEENRK